MPKMNVAENNNQEDFDQIDSGMSRQPPAVQSVVSGTQTDEFDTVDCRVAVAAGVARGNGHANGASCQEGGLLSNLLTFVRPAKRRASSGEAAELVERNRRCVATQTEESPLAIKARELCCMVIEALALESAVTAPSSDDVYEAVCCCVCEILEKHSILFNGMVRRFDVTDYRVFTSIANELFEVNSESSEWKITWGRIVSLFAYGVKLAQSYRESHEEEKIDYVVNYLSDYICKHLLDFVETEGGWEGLVKVFPLPDTEEKQVKRAMMWSGLCVGLVATIVVAVNLGR